MPNRDLTSERRAPVPDQMRPAKALERPPCRTGTSPLNDAVQYRSAAAGVTLERPPCRTGTSTSARHWSSTLRRVTVDHEDDLAGLQRTAPSSPKPETPCLPQLPGVSTAELDEVGRNILDRHGARPAPPTVGFPAATCVSINDEAAHGIPSPWRRLADGDLVNVDVSAELDGYLGGHGRQRRRRHRLRHGADGCSRRPGWPTVTPSPRRGQVHRCATSGEPCSAGPSGPGSR